LSNGSTRSRKKASPSAAEAASGIKNRAVSFIRDSERLGALDDGESTHENTVPPPFFFMSLRDYFPNDRYSLSNDTQTPDQALHVTAIAGAEGWLRRDL
jgi:hypothetical protein